MRMAMRSGRSATALGARPNYEGEKLPATAQENQANYCTELGQ